MPRSGRRCAANEESASRRQHAAAARCRAQVQIGLTDRREPAAVALAPVALSAFDTGGARRLRFPDRQCGSVPARCLGLRLGIDVFRADWHVRACGAVSYAPTTITMTTTTRSKINPIKPAVVSGVRQDWWNAGFAFADHQKQIICPCLFRQHLSMMSAIV